MRERAETLAERIEGWAYQIPQYILDRLSQPKSEWLKEPDETSYAQPTRDAWLGRLDRRRDRP